MWSLLQSDLKEFVTNVTEDAGLNKSTDEYYEVETPGGTKTIETPGGTKISPQNLFSPGESSYVTEDEEEEGAVTCSDDTIEEVLSMLIEDTNTFTKPLLNTNDEEEKIEIEEFLKEFSIDSKRDEIAKFLNQNKEDDGNNNNQEEEAVDTQELEQTQKEALEDEINMADVDIQSPKEGKENEEIAKERENDNNKSDDNGNSDNDLLLLPNRLSIALKKQFDTLVAPSGELSSEDFWERYYYRCDVNRIKNEYEKESRLVEDQRTEAINAGISSVTNFLGDSFKAVSTNITTAAANTKKPNLPNPTNLLKSMSSSLRGQQQNQTTAAAATASFFTGNAGRPPFVMNTVILSDDEQHSEEEEDEELGWDDDDDEDDDDNNNVVNVSGVSSVEIDFTHNDVQDQLEQANIECDQVVETMKLYENEIIALKKQIYGDDYKEEDISKRKQQETSYTEQIDSLSLDIINKESEIAALKVKLLKTNKGNDGSNNTNEDENSIINEILSKNKEHFNHRVIVKLIKNLSNDQFENLKTEVFE